MTRPSRPTHTGTLAQSNAADAGPRSQPKPEQQNPFQLTLSVHLPRAASNVRRAQLDLGSR